MDNFILTRADVQSKLRDVTRSIQDKDAVREIMKAWMEEQGCDTDYIKRVLNDLTSYSEYLDLLN